MSDYPHKSHDEFFKASFGQLEIARDYLEQLLPREVHQSLDLSQLKRVNGSWVTPELEEYFSDVVYRCPIKEGKRQVWASFLLEHKNQQVSDFVVSLLAYFFKNTEIERETINRFIKHLPDNLNHNVMSTYDMIQAEGIEQGAELKEREIIKNLWSFQEFSLEKIAFLSGASLERVVEILSAHLQAEGLNEAVAAQTLEAYQAKFV